MRPATPTRDSTHRTGRGAINRSEHALSTPADRATYPRYYWGHRPEGEQPRLYWDEIEVSEEEFRAGVSRDNSAILGMDYPALSDEGDGDEGGVPR